MIYLSNNTMIELRRTSSTIILHVAPIAKNYISGLTSAIPPSIDALQRLGVQTGLLTTSSNGRYEKPESYPVVYIRDLPRIGAIASMPEPLNQPDLIVFHSTYVLSHIPIVYEAIQKKIPYIIKPHGGMTQGAQEFKALKKKVGNLLFFNWMVRNATAIHCLTQSEAEDVKKLWDTQVFIVGNGVNLPSVKKLRFNLKELKFIFLGRLNIYQKGLDLLLEACRVIQEKLRREKVQIFLYGPDEGDSAAELNKLINIYQIQDLIHLKGTVYGEEKHAVFQEADLFIHTSRFEGHPMAVMEALSYGVPCLLTPGTNMAPEVVEAGAGWAVESNGAAIAQGLSNILAVRSEIPTRGQAARYFVENKYSWAQIGKQSQAEYEKILMQVISPNAGLSAAQY